MIGKSKCIIKSCRPFSGNAPFGYQRDEAWCGTVLQGTRLPDGAPSEVQVSRGQGIENQQGHCLE